MTDYCTDFPCGFDCCRSILIYYCIIFLLERKLNRCIDIHNSLAINDVYWVAGWETIVLVCFCLFNVAMSRGVWFFPSQFFSKTTEEKIKGASHGMLNFKTKQTLRCNFEAFRMKCVHLSLSGSSFSHHVIKPSISLLIPGASISQFRGWD